MFDANVSNTLTQHKINKKNTNLLQKFFTINDEIMTRKILIKQNGFSL